ncbi:MULTISPECIES: condensin complex protein MksE [Flavobacteriaceae]|jgi:chromosome condensin MukBEF MukE localization factor|uniref:condensin complex protein MksE n=1 Tax=Flavobacteriaceae TaxID=49546 RepID=UPI000C978577|nr:hypothetical protein [Altibacter sp.]MAP56076.1 hypothetical protein [Altibacter sp.]|tara:strand:- start:3248 stop:3898 length:651 start_codon:yes stop_codon:yes gene_type:complete
MEHNSNGTLEFLKFYEDPDAPTYFGELDYYLKDGIHIQEYGDQINYYKFLKKHKEDLNKYYQHFYGIHLMEENLQSDSYFFLNFNTSNRGKIPSSHRDVLKNKYIIVGIIMYKIIFYEGNVELNSLAALQEMIRNDYEEYKEGLIRLFAQSSGDVKIDDDDKMIDNVVLAALQNFKRLGWIDLDQDYFETRPSFQRINTIYEDIIPKIDDIIASYQ